MFLKKPGMMVYSSNPSYEVGIGRRIVVQDELGKKM
jgi:hypothetical protein